MAGMWPADGGKGRGDTLLDLIWHRYM